MSSQDNTVGRHVSGKTADKVFKGVAYGCGILILVVLAAVALFLLFRAWPLIGGDQKANSATISNFTGGKATNFWQYVGPLLFGTVLVSALALLISFFISVGIALFISHYAPKKLATVLSYVVDLLAAIPSVIYGLWGGLVLVPAIYPFWNWLSKTFGWIPIFAGPAANPSRTVATVSVVLAVMTCRSSPPCRVTFSCKHRACRRKPRWRSARPGGRWSSSPYCHSANPASSPPPCLVLVVRSARRWPC